MLIINTEVNTSLPPGQRWLLNKLFAYANDKKAFVKSIIGEGTCYGFACEAGRRILQRKTAWLDQLLLAISQIPIDDFAITVNAIEKKRLAIIRRVEQQFAKSKNDANQQMAIATLLSSAQVQKKIKQLDEELDQSIQEGKLAPAQKDSELSRRSQLLLEHTYLQNQIADEVCKLSKIEQRLLEVRSLMDSLIFYHQSLPFKHLFPKSFHAGIQDYLAANQIIHPEAKIIKLDSIIGVYTLPELTNFIQRFYTAFLKATETIAEPIHFLLSASNHSISIGFDPLIHQWLLLDVNSLPTKYFDDIAALAKTIKNALTANEHCLMQTELFVQQQFADTYQKVLNDWKNQPDFKSMHAITIEKAAVTDSNGANLLYLAAEQGSLELVDQLLTKPININQTTNDDTTPLYIAAQNGHINIVKKLLANNAAIKNNELYIACQNGFSDIVKYLLTQGADANDPVKAIYPLYIAAQNGHLEIVKDLIEQGADVNALSDGVTPLYIAAQRGHHDIVKLLLENGASIDYGWDNITPLYIATQNKHLEVIKLLLDNQANLNAQCVLSPLYLAAQNGYRDIVNCLLDKGALNNPIHCYKEELLGYLKKLGVCKERQALMAHKAPNALSGKIAVTPLEIAIVMGHEAIASAIFHAQIKVLNLNPNKKQARVLGQALQAEYEALMVASQKNNVPVTKFHFFKSSNKTRTKKLSHHQHQKTKMR